MLCMKHIHTFAFLAICSGSVMSQTVLTPGVNAGSLLEDQRRQAAPPVPAQRSEPGALPSLPPTPAIAEAGPGSSVLTTVTAFSVEGNTLMDATVLQAALAPWLNRPVSLAELRLIPVALEALYRARGWLVRASLPAQDITEGTVRITVAEARLGKLSVAEAPASDAAGPVRPVGPRLMARVRALLDNFLPAGQPLNLASLERALLLADDIPGVRISGSLQASDEPGGTDVFVTVARRPVLRGEGSFDNGGNRATGAERLTARLSLQSPFDGGEQFNLGGSVSAGSRFVSVGASAPVGNRGWRAALAASALRYAVRGSRNTTPDAPPEGDSSTVGASLQIPLVRTSVANWQFTVGWGQTRLHNRDDIQTPNLQETTNRAQSRAVTLSVAGNQFDQLAGGGVTSASVALVSGRLDLDGSPPLYVVLDALTTATQGHFTKLRWNASRLQNLTPTVSLYGTATGQWANANLDPSEKIYLGGSTGVRAYPNSEGGGSTGMQFSLDLRKELSPQWQASVFYDWGQVHQYKHNAYAAFPLPLSGQNSITLKGYGLGVTWRGGPNMQVSASWARRIGHNPLATANGNDTDGSRHQNRVWLNASIAF
jgi:hemolysin activation/secretion protein